MKLIFLFGVWFYPSNISHLVVHHKILSDDTCIVKLVDAEYGYSVYSPYDCNTTARMINDAIERNTIVTNSH